MKQGKFFLSGRMINWFNLWSLVFLLCVYNVWTGDEYVFNKDGQELTTQTTRVSRTGSPLTIDLVEVFEAKAAKRGVYNSTSRNWHPNIPFVMNPAFKGDQARLQQVFNYISSKLCVTFHNVTDIYNVSDSHWLQDHGFASNAYLMVSGTNGCFSEHGEGPGLGVRYTYPCNEFGINLHEIMHTLGVVHTHQQTIRDSYMTVHTGDIQTSLRYSYGKIIDPTLVNEYFDGTSIMKYDDSTWGSDGMETFTPIRDDVFKTSYAFSEENVAFYELSQIYKCNEKFCHNDTTDCSPGYHTLYHGKCQCVCPDDLDPFTNCKSQINGPTPNLTWPNTPMLLYGTHRCPQGFDPVPGMLPLTLRAGPRQEPVPEKFNITGNTITVLLCSKSTPLLPTEYDWSTWPIGGQLCFVKPVGVDCGGYFENGGIEFTIKEQPHPAGNIGDVRINGTKVTMNFCCKNKEHRGTPIDLPNSEPFTLLPKSYFFCPVVRGMKSTWSALTIWTSDCHSFGPVPPLSFFYTTSFYHYECFYQPPIYGCNRVVNLTLTNRSVTITTPGYPGHREPNRRCLYGFNVPENVQLRLTLNDIDLHKNDDFLVKRFHKWQDPYKIPNTDSPYQLISESSYLSLQFWSSWETTDKKGVNFTVDLLPNSKMCYDVTARGEDYSGNKSVSETYEDCVPWTHAVTCEDFPFHGFDGVSLLLSGNKCRNPGGALLQPWCYTYVRDQMCHKRYCDVCNLYTPVDVIKNCTTLKALDPNFCTSGIERFGCFQTCQLSPETYNRAQCPAPTLPLDTMVADGLKTKYYEGESINITCKTSRALIHELRCTYDGWSGIPFGCNGCPEGWTVYGNRCYQSRLAATRRQAEEICRSHDATGSLFEIRGPTDQQMIVENMKNNYSHLTGTWISGKLQSEYGQWLFDSGDPVTYFNWSPLSDTTSVSRSCIKLLADDQTSGDTGTWMSVHCEDTDTLPFICQVDKLKSDACNDNIRTCAEVLSKFPDFCHLSSTSSLASTYCKKSCGRCTDRSIMQCNDPSNSDRYVRTSSATSVSAGAVMTFACKNGFYHVGGDLKRTCTYTGQFLGLEPVCQATPIAVDLKVDTIRKRRETLGKGISIILDHDSYRLPFDGRVTAWYYYCNNAGDLYFIIMRKSSTGYHYVGSNSATCQPNWARSYRVPAPQQIHALKDDVFGVFSLNVTALSVTDCDSAPVKLLQLPAINVTSLQSLQVTTTSLFAGHKCVVPSLGLRLEP